MKYPQLVSMPSAVSDWLEEELEARGIDAVVYTRYVLSLLHRDTQDLVSSEQDLHQVPKERQRGRKRLRRSANWWRNVRSDVEQIRRSAAVECLMSAAEQTCGIESLVDELCEKLKHFNSPPDSCSLPSVPRDPSGGSPEDLARRYYAAFPPLSKTASANLITLITSQRKKNQPRKQEMKSRKRLTYRNKRDFGFARSMERSTERQDFSDWDLLMNRTGDEGYSTSDTTSEFDQSETKNKNIDEAHLAKLVAKFDRKIEALWNTEKEEYHDLPVDLQQLLASPTDILNNKSTFIQCGTNITSSIWTDSKEESEKSFYSNLYNEKILGDQFNSLSVTSEAENNFSSLPWELEINFSKWSEAENYNLDNLKAVSDSLQTLNHNKEASCFKEVVPKQLSGLPSFIQPKIETKPIEPVQEEEDLLTSTKTHFKPIKQETINSHGKYADGTTFAIKSSLEHINYRRSDSGALYLESGFDSPKKYMEYRSKNSEETDKDFVLKFCVKQSEKYCQTDEISQEVPHKKRVLSEDFFFPGDEELLTDDYEKRELAEINWNSWKKCDKCNNNWKNNLKKDAIWSSEENKLKNAIWSSSEELCRSCLGVPAGPGPRLRRSLEYSKLREELSEDGEQLLSDLSCLQRVYMELPEISYDLNDSYRCGNQERKRRHSSRNSWTNTSCLKAQNVFTPPLLRPVTL